MTTPDERPDSQSPPGGSQSPPREPTEEELLAAYEAELKQIKVADVLIQTIVSLLNLAGRRLGTAPQTADERDLDQVRDAIDATRALLPLVERRQIVELGPVKDALAQLQLAYAKQAGEAHGAGEAGVAAQQPGGSGEPGAGERGAAPTGPGPAQAAGRLWVPGS